MTAESFVRTELLSNTGLTILDLLIRPPPGLRGDSIRLAVLHMLNTGEVDVDLNHKLTLTREVKS